MVDKKIILLRKAKNIKKAAFASDVLYCDPSKVYNVEKGIGRYSGPHIKLAKKFFDIEDMPLTAYECKHTYKRLYHILDYNRAERLDESKAILDKLAKLVNLDPCDNKLPLLYRLFEVHYLLVTSQLDIAEEKLDYLQSRFDIMDAECQYYFYFDMGYLRSVQGRDKESLEHYNKALELTKSQKDFVPNDIERLHTNIGACYTNLAVPYRAISYLKDIRERYVEVERVKFNLHSASLLATNYININELKVAEELLNECLVQAESIGDGFYLGLTALSLGILNVKTENWKIALEHFDKSLTNFEEGTRHYLATLYQKIRCLSRYKKFAEAKRLLEKSISLYGTYDVYGTLFESLRHFIEVRCRISRYNQDSVKYLETVAIPHLKKTNAYFEAIDYYKLLALYYEKKNKRKSLSMSNAILDIYERCFLLKY